MEELGEYEEIDGISYRSSQDQREDIANFEAKLSKAEREITEVAMIRSFLYNISAVPDFLSRFMSNSCG